LELRDGHKVRTGYFLSELSAPLVKMLKSGIDPVFATPKGIPPEAEPLSESLLWFGGSLRQYLSSKRLVDRLETLQRPLSFDQVLERGLDPFDGVFVPGGHAAMV